MKIGLIVPLNTRIAPYISNYISYFQKNHIDYKVIVWDKLGEEDSADYTFNYRANDFNRFQIFIGYIFYALKCRRIIKQEKFDRLVIFTVAPMFFLGKAFLKRFKEKFILDVRDDTPFRRKFPGRLQKMGDLAYAITVSSPKYAAWFNKSILCHNVEKMNVETALTYTFDTVKSNVIKIVYAGIMIEAEKNIQVISMFKNNEKFKLIYIGRENEGIRKIKQYVDENGVRNVEFQGEYKKEQIIDIYRAKADLVNIFRAKSVVNEEALPNKLYDAVLAGVPIVVFDHNQSIVDYAKKYSLGLIIEDKSDISEELFRKYQEFSFRSYETGRKEFLRMVLSDLVEYEKMLDGFVD